MIKLKVRKIVERGEKGVEIEAISGILTIDELPVRYSRKKGWRIEGFTDDSFNIYQGDELWWRVGVRSKFDTGEFKQIIVAMKAAANRLHCINVQAKKVKAQWHGSYIVDI